MPRELKTNPMEVIPGPCPCGAPSARSEIAVPACHVCRAIAADNPEWTRDQVAAAGRRRWLELILRGIRRVALQGGPGTSIVRELGRGLLVEWGVRDGYERLVIHGDAGPVREVLDLVHPELAIAAEVPGEGTLALKLQAREGALCAL